MTEDRAAGRTSRDTHGDRAAGSLVLGALLGAFSGIVENLVLVGVYGFIFPTPHDLRIFALGTMALDIALGVLLVTACRAALPQAWSWPVAVTLGLCLLAVGHLHGNFAAYVAPLGTAGRTALFVVPAAAAGLAVRRLPAALPAARGVRRPYLVLLALAIALALVPSGMPGATGDGPNVLLVVVDTLRADRVGFDGAPAPMTPFLDRLARRGVTASHATSITDSTTTSFASLLSGLHVYRHGVRGFDYLLADDLETLPETLRAAGYATFGFSSSFPACLAYHRFDQGLDHRDDTSIPRPFPWLPPVEAVERLAAFRVVEVLGWRILPQNKISGSREADMTTRAVQDLLGRGFPAPWFGMVHYYDPHSPYSPPRIWSAYDKGQQGIGVGDLDAHFERAQQKKPGWLRAPTIVRDPDFPVRAYEGEVAFVDHHVGRLLAEVRRRGEGDRTLVVFTADHGENLLEHGKKMLFNHDGLYETQVRIPLMLSGAGLPPAVIDATVRNMDIYATVCDALGIAAPRNDGRSFAPLWRGAPWTPTEPVLIEAPEDWKLALRRGGHKLLRNVKGAPDALYDLEADPGELHDLAGERPEILAAMQHELAGIIPGGAASPADTQLLDEEQMEALRALGYIEGPDHPAPDPAPPITDGAPPPGAPRR